jgi:alpha-L-fucosidase
MDTLNRGNVNGKHWMPAEADVSIRPGWFYHPEQDDQVKSPETLFKLYLQSVGNGGNLLLNVPPDRRGRFHPADSAALVGFRLLRDQAFQHNLFRNASIQSKPTSDKRLEQLLDENNATWWMADEANPVEINLHLKRPTRLNSIVLEEMIAYGQRVQAFELQAKLNGSYQSIFTGTTIGRKKIATFPAIETTDIRLTITSAKAAPILRNLSAYFMEGH